MSADLRCFIIMPFHRDFLPVRDLIQRVVAHRGGISTRADDHHNPGDIVDQLKTLISLCDYCVADITDNNPNVLWEVGFARALGKPVIALRQNLKDMPFDIRGDRVCDYQLADLKPAGLFLLKSIAAVREEIASNPLPLAWRYDELSQLREALAECKPMRSGADLLTILQDAVRKCGPIKWKPGKGKELMKAITKGRKAGEYEDSFWWLIVHGVFCYDQIDDFYAKSHGWTRNIHLVELSPRGVAFLKWLQESEIGAAEIR